MSQEKWGPVDITQGNLARFTIKFSDSDGNIIVPSATLNVVYTNTSNVSQTDNVSLYQLGTQLTGIWNTAIASPGLADWEVHGTFGSSASQNGQIRVLTGFSQSAPPFVSDWILATGFWNDAGFWRDTSIWID